MGMIKKMAKLFYRGEDRKTPFLPLYNQITNDIIDGKLLTPEGNRYSYNTGYNYKTGIYRFQLYEEKTGEIYLENISIEWAEKFVIFQMEQGYCKNSIAISIIRLKAVLRRLYNSGISKFNGSGIRVNSEMVTTVFTTIEELQQLLGADMINTPGLSKIRDMYVLHCFLGLRYSDLKCLLKEPKTYLRSMGNKLFFDIKTQKTGEQVIIPINRTVKYILDKYNYEFGNIVSYQYYNNAIKQMAYNAGLNDEIIFTRTEGGKRVDTKKIKSVLMSSHTARRTFATNAFLAGMPERNIMLITGHKTMQAFQRYIRCSAMDAAIKIANHDFFNIELVPFSLIDEVTQKSIPQ